MLGGFIPRLRRRLDEGSWISIGEESRSETPAFAKAVTTARVDGPPDFSLPNPPEPVQTPPPSYAHVRNTSRPEIANLLVTNRASYTSHSSTNVTPRQPHQPLQPAVRSTLTNLDDIRHAEAVNHVPMDNRLSSVPNYPVFLPLDQPPNFRRRRSRRPASLASTTSTGLFLSMSQLPGSEPFDIQTSQTASARDNNGQRSQGPKMSPLFSPDSTISTAETARASVITIQRVRSAQPKPFLLETSNMTPRNGEGRCSLPAEGFYAPQPHAPRHPTIKQSHTWPAQRQSANMGYPDDDVRVRLASVYSDIPPRPPPKDPGYVSRPPGGERRGDNGLRPTQSSPNMLRLKGSQRRSQKRSTHPDPPGTKPGRVDSPQFSSSRRTFSNRRLHIVRALGKLLSSRSVRPVVAA